VNPLRGKNEVISKIIKPNTITPIKVINATIPGVPNSPKEPTSPGSK